MTSDIVDSEQQATPINENGDDANGGEQRGIKRQRSSANAAAADDDGDDDEGRERRKIEIKFIQDKSRRHITFSKRKAGIMKKAYELSVLTGTQVLLLVVSETGLVYTFTTPKLQPLVTKTEGKNLIQACLNAPEAAEHNGIEAQEPAEESDEAQAQQSGPPQLQQRNPPMMPQPPYNMPSTEQQQAMQYQAYLQQHQQQQQHPGQQPGPSAYPMPVQPMAPRQ